MSNSIEKQIYFGSKNELEQFENSKEIYFSDCFNFEKTYSYPRDYEVDFSNLHHVHYGDIHTKFPNTITKDITLPHIKNEKQNYVTLLPGDIVVADASEDHKDLGKTVLFTDAERNVIAGLHTHFLRNNNNIIDSKYYLYFTKTDRYIREMRRLGTGISVLGISKTNLSKIKIPYESLENQKKIAATLSQIDNLIFYNHQQIHQIRSMNKRVLDDIFNKKLVADGIIWQRRTLNSIFIGVDKRTTMNNQHPILTSTKTRIYLQSEYFKNQIASQDNIGYKILCKNQLVLSPQNAWMGNININDKYNIGIVSPSYKVYNVSYDIQFIQRLIKTQFFINLIQKNSDSGASTVRKNLDIEMFLKEKIALPNISHQYSNILFQMDKLIEIEEKKLEQLEKMKKYHLQQFFK